MEVNDGENSQAFSFLAGRARRSGVAAGRVRLADIPVAHRDAGSNAYPVDTADIHGVAWRHAGSDHHATTGQNAHACGRTGAK
jgi:hypothetical protein